MGGWRTVCRSHPLSVERWNNWGNVPGVLCDRKGNVKIKGKVYRTVVRLPLMHGIERVAQEKKLGVAELRMLRRRCRVTKLDSIRNYRIRGTTRVGEMSKKVK